MKTKRGSIFVVDIGNSEIDFGVFRGGKILCQFSKKTDISVTVDELELFVSSLMARDHMPLREIHGISVCSVVPEMTNTVLRTAQRLFNKKTFIVQPKMKSPLRLRVDHPQEIGSDRVVNAVAAFSKVQGPVVVVDFGTATTFTVVTARGALTGGAILPGLNTLRSVLSTKTAQLPSLELKVPGPFIGRNTLEALGSGVIHGYVGTILYLIDGMKKELKSPGVKIIATGGLSPFICPMISTVDSLEPLLTLEGLGMLFHLND